MGIHKEHNATTYDLNIVSSKECVVLLLLCSSLDFVFGNKFTYLTLKAILSLNNPQNNEMKFCENMKLTC
jgi:hypothetical protein